MQIFSTIKHHEKCLKFKETQIEMKHGDALCVHNADFFQMFFFRKNATNIICNKNQVNVKAFHKKKDDLGLQKVKMCLLVSF